MVGNGSHFITSCLLAPLIVLMSQVAHADIFVWEYVDPANPSLGKQMSTTLVPGGTGVSAGQGVDLSNLNLTKAYLIGSDLSPAVHCDTGDCYNIVANLTGAMLAQADLSHATLHGAILTGADLTAAEVLGTNFSRYFNDPTGGLTALQLYSTASYQGRNLAGIGLTGHQLAGIDLHSQNLAGARLNSSDLTNANLSQANLSDANLVESAMAGANLSGAEVRGALLSNVTLTQLYSTASYQTNDMTGINLDRNNLAGANFAGQNLTRGSFYGTALANANFEQANLSQASFTYPAGIFPGFGRPVTDLSGANLSGAILTGARLGGGEECLGEFCWLFQGANLNLANLSGADARNAYLQGASTLGTDWANMIQPHGHIDGLDLRSNKRLIVRNYLSPGSPVPIVVDQSQEMDATSTLQFVLDADPWGSTISFEPGIAVTLGGTLELLFAPGTNTAALAGQTFDLFDWTGVTPSGMFAVVSPYTWDLTNLYTTGEVALSSLPLLAGDYNSDGRVDAADYTVWRNHLGSAAGTLPNDVDGGTIGTAQYLTWKAHFGNVAPGMIASSAAVPEPAALMSLSMWLLAIGATWTKLRRDRLNRHA